MDISRFFKNKYTILSILLFVFGFFIIFFALNKEYTRVKAEESLSFARKKYSFYEGNIKKLSLIYGSTEFFQDTDEFHNDWDASFSSSDENVVRVSFDGSVDCVGLGNAQITASYNGLTAVCNITVKANKLRVSEEEVILYSNQSSDVRITGVKDLVNFAYDISNVGVNYGKSEKSEPEVKINGDGRFTIIAGSSGDYVIRLIGSKLNGTTYSKKLILHIIEAGPSKRQLCVAFGCKNKIEMNNADILSVELIEWVKDYKVYSPSSGTECPIKSDGTGGFYAEKCSSEISAVYRVYYITEDLTNLYADIEITAYEPIYEPFEDYLLVGRYYKPVIVDKGSISKIICTSSDPDILEVDESGNICPLKSGQVTLFIYIDGKEFADAIDIVDVKMNDESLMTWPGCVFSYKVSGVPKGVKVKYTSTNPEVASITKKGKLKTKKIGYTTVIVQIGSEKNYYSVNVGSETAVKALQFAANAVGKAKYSQDNRMEEGYFDCSSLAWRSYASAGKKFKYETYAPTAAELAEYMKENGYTISYEALPVEEMQPGDLLFSSTGSDNGRFMRIDHVALYYATFEANDEGNKAVKGKIVHAGRNGGGVYYSNYPGFLNIVMIARFK